MPDSVVTGSAIGGFAGGLADTLLQHRQDQRQQQQFEEERNDRFLAQMIPIFAANAPDISALEPLLQQFHPEVFGKPGKPGKPGGAFDAVTQVLQPIRAAAQQQATPSTDPTVTGLVGQTPVTTPQAEPAPPSHVIHTVRGDIPVLSPEEQAQRTQDANVRSRLALADAAQRILPRLKQLDPTITLAGALDFLENRSIAPTRNVIPHALGKAVAAEDINPADATDASGHPVDLSTSKFWQQFQDNTGRVYVQPTSQTGAGGYKLPTGQVGQYIGEALLQNGIADPANATKEDVAKAIPVAQTIMKREITNKDDLASSLEAVRSLALQVGNERLGNLPTADDLQQNAQPITVGGKTYNFVSKGTWSGTDAQNAAQKASGKAGVIVVSPQEAQQLSSAQSALSNVNAFYDQIESKLPKDAQGRPLGAAENKLSQYFQTDADLASSVAWDVSVIPMLRALGTTNRITNTEFNKAVDARPKITDTVAVAKQKRDILNKIVEDAVSPILGRGSKGQPVQTDAAKRVKAAQYLSSIQKTNDGSAVDAFLKKNPDFK